MFSPSTTIGLNNLDHDLRNTESYSLFNSSILKFIRPSANSFYGSQDIMGIKLVSRLCLGLSHLRKHKFKHRFLDTLTISVILGWMSNPPPIFYSNLPRISTKNTPPWATWIELTPKYLKIFCNFWQTHSFLGIRLIVRK